jgi:antirestriction protein ArdC
MTETLNKISAKDYLTNLKNDIITAMEKDGLKWFKPFISKDAPQNAITKKNYSGVNFWNLNYILNKNEFTHNLWASYLDWQKVGAKVLEGQSHKAKVLYYGSFTKENEKTKKEDKIPFLKATPVFNVSQVDLSNSSFKLDVEPIKNEVENIAEIDLFVKNTNIEIKHGIDARCYYTRTGDYIHMSNKENFLSCENATATVHYYSTLFHELIHATGHSLRLDRFKDNDKKFKDSEQKSYAFEELVAETGSVLLSQHFGIEKTLRDNHAIYLKSWISALKNDTKFLTSALAKSYRAYDYFTKTTEKQILKAVA